MYHEIKEYFTANFFIFHIVCWKEGKLLAIHFILLNLSPIWKKMNARCNNSVNM